MQATGRVFSRVRDQLATAEGFPWGVFALLGATFTLLGAWEIYYDLIPIRLGSPEWEFGTISAVFDSMPLLALGLALTVGAGLALGLRWVVRLVATAFLLLTVYCLLAVVLYATNIPMVLAAAPANELLTALKKGMAKAAVQGTVYPIAFLWAAIAAWRRSLAGRTA